MMNRIWSLVVVCTVFWALPALGEEPACKGWIGVDSGEEAGATIVIDGKKYPSLTPATIKGVPCGKHTVEIKKPLFKGGKQTIDVKAGDVIKVRVVLKANFGSLQVGSTPEKAEVWVDGKQVGKTPWAAYRMEAGAHMVSVRLPDHDSVERKVVLKPGKKIALKLKLAPNYGQLDIKVNVPEEAIVWLDGDPLGPAPMTLKRVVAGPHTVRISSEMYKPFQKKILVKRGKAAKIKAVLKPNYGSLTVRTKPAGGRVRIDGKEVGVAPVTVKLAPGLHAVWAAGQGPSSSPVEAKVKVKLRGKHKMVLRLPIKTGSLMVDSVPFAATIEIDGKKRGKAPLSLKGIPVGVHVLLAKAKGLPPLAGRIEVVEGKRSVAEMNLKDPPKSKYAVPKSDTVAAVAPKPDPKPVAKPEPKPDPKPTPVAKVEPKPEPKPDPKPKPKTKSDPKPVAKVDPKPEPKTTPKFVDDGSSGSANTEVTARAAAPVSFQRIAAWSTGGIAVAAAVSMGALFGVGFSRQTDADDAYKVWVNNKTTANENYYRDLDDEAAKFKNVGWAMAGAAVAFGTASALLFMLEPEPEVDSTGPTVGLSAAPMPGGGWVGYELKF